MAIFIALAQNGMTPSPIDTSGLSHTHQDRLQATHLELENQFNIQPTGTIDFHLEDFEFFKQYQDVTVRKSYVIKNNCSNCYILFVDTHVKKIGPKGKITEHDDCQTWGLAYLKEDFGRVKIRPETLVDKIGELIHPIELDFKEDKAFSDTFFVLVNDRDKAVQAMDRHFRNAVMDIREDDFVIEIVNHTLIIGSRKPISPGRAVYLAAFIYRVAAL